MLIIETKVETFPKVSVMKIIKNNVINDTFLKLKLRLI